MEALFMFVLIFYAAYFGVRRGVPAAFRAMKGHRRKKIRQWRKQHPNAPTVARWWAGAGATVATLRWGPRFFWNEFVKAFKDAFDGARTKYDVFPPEPKKEEKPGSKSGDKEEPVRCITCDGPLPRNKNAPGGYDPCPRCKTEPDETDEPGTNEGAEQEKEPATPDGTDPSQPDRSNKPVETIEITGPTSLLNAMRAKLANATAEFEAADAAVKRAVERVKANDEVINALRGFEFPTDDLNVFVGLMEPDNQAVAAAEAEKKACESRVVAASNCVKVAEKHLRIKQEQSPAGRFYQGE